MRVGSFVVAHAGIFQGTLVIAASLLLTVLTATSLSAIATNGEVEGGGAYFLISRSLGAELGGAIGLLFALANAISVSMYLVGFAETVVGLYADSYAINRAWDIRGVAFLGLILCTAVACAGANWVVKIDVVQLVVLCIGILAFVVGTFTTDEDVSGLAFTGYSSSTFAANWGPNYRATDTKPGGEDFMSVFSVFFPAGEHLLRVLLLYRVCLLVCLFIATLSLISPTLWSSSVTMLRAAMYRRLYLTPQSTVFSVASLSDGHDGRRQHLRGAQGRSKELALWHHVCRHP